MIPHHSGLNHFKVSHFLILLVINEAQYLNFRAQNVITVTIDFLPECMKYGICSWYEV